MDGEIERIERPQRDGRRRGVEPGDNAVAQLRGEHRLLLAVAQRFDAAADGGTGALRQHQIALIDQPIESHERRRAVARMRQRAGVVARLVPPALGVGDERRQKPHQGPPFLHGAAEIVHGFLVGTLRVDHRGAGLGQNIGRNGAHNRSDRRFRLQGWFLAHDRF